MANLQDHVVTAAAVEDTIAAAVEDTVAPVEDTVAAAVEDTLAAAVEDTISAVEETDSAKCDVRATPDLRTTAPAPFVPTVGACAKPLTTSSRSSPTELENKVDVTVAQDGTGNFTTVKEAVAAAPENSKTRYVILVKKGVYDEIIRIDGKKTNLTILGEGRDVTVLTGSLNRADGVKTFDSATLAVDGIGFMAQDLCIRNTAGPAKGQAVALRVSGDMAVIYRCRIEAYQDTLYAHDHRHFYRDCYITGTVDFICGHATAVFQYCEIEARKPGIGQSNMITAQQCETDVDRSWFSMQKCNIRATPDLAPIKGTVKTFLGRPWGYYSTVVFMQSFIDDLIDPAGWAPWDTHKGRLSTLFYGEYQNNGPGADTARRVQWEGFKILTDPKEAAKFTVRQLVRGESWLSSTGVPYEEDL